MVSKGKVKKTEPTNITDESKSFTPRDYQIEILESAKKGNVIACLGTGTGKTFIAVLLIRESAAEVRIPYDKGGKRIFFLVPTVPLVLQQSKTISEHTDLKVKGYYGAMDVDSWSKEQWEEELTNSEVLVMTAEIFRIMIEHKFLAPNRIELLVVDECHRAQGDHPYRSALKCIVDMDKNEMPKIFGLSASLLNGKCKPSQLEKKLKELEITMNSRIVTANDLTDLRKFGTDPNENVVMYSPYTNCSEDLIIEIHAHIAQFETDNKGEADKRPREFDFFQRPIKSLKALEKTLATLGPWCALRAAQIYEKEVKSLLLKVAAKDYEQELKRTVDFLEYFSQVCSALVESVGGMIGEGMPHKLQRLLEVFSAAKKRLKVQSEQQPMTIEEIGFEDDPESHHQFLKSIEIQSQQTQLCCIVFVEQRITAYALCEWLKQAAGMVPGFDFMKPEFVVGHGTFGGGGGEMSMSEKLQQKKLRSFRDGSCNILVATQVLEEGVDVRQCNLVVRFDPPIDFRAYVQSKGRARSKESLYVVMIEEGLNYDKFIMDLCNFKTIEEVLTSKCHDRAEPSQEEVLQHMTDDEIPPYMPKGPDGPRITMTSAISLINRYCSSLPSDMATKLAPKWNIREIHEDQINQEYECSLKMPINSPLARYTIVSEARKQKRLAKMCAALKACKLLDELKELNEHLVPISCLVDQALEEELGQEEEEDGMGAIPGTNRRRQAYKKKIPACLQNAKPMPDVPCYLHIIQMELVFPLPNQLNPRGRPIMDPAKTPRGLAILTTEPLPKVNPFPLFNKHGKLMVTFSTSNLKVKLSEAEIKEIESFHRFIFSDALCIEDNHLFFPENAFSSYYIVPVNNGQGTDDEIDWGFINLTKYHSYHSQITRTSATAERPIYTEEAFRDAVVLRSYKMDMWSVEPKTFHHVIRVLSDKSPSSEFLCDAKYKTFSDYFKLKYNAVIHNKLQPLIETVQSGGLHMWKPVYQSVKETFDDKAIMSKSKQRHKNYREYLVPELCIIHPFPSSFFTKVLCLPTILFRLHQLLLAEEIRCTLANEAKVGLPVPQNMSFHWPPFHLETSDKTLREHLMSIKVLKEDFKNELIPCDIVKDGYNIKSFDVKVDLQSNVGPEPRVLLQALTPKSTGDEFDLERLELIGDSFLKYAMTVKCYVKYFNFDEGKLTRLRIGLIQNRTLYRLGKKKGLPHLMTTTAFNCKSTWLPPGYAIEEIIDESTLIKKTKTEAKQAGNKPGEVKKDNLHQYFTKQVISDKCVADCVEALIGSYLLSCGQEGALRFMAWLGLNPLDSDASEFDFAGKWPPSPPNPVVVNNNDEADLIRRLSGGLERFEEIIGYKFKNRAYLLQAFTHPSYSDNSVTDCYQRLEFLGDAVLDYLITRQLYEDPSNHSPGELTDLRSALVNNGYFAFLAVKFQYNKFLKIMSPHLFKLVQDYIRMLCESETFKYFEEHLYILEELECFELEEVEVPKALGDVFESVAGAIYLDSGMSLDAVWKIYYPMIEPALKHMVEHVPKSPVRQLYEFVKAQKLFGEAITRGEKTYIQVVLPNGRKFEGVGPNKKVAKISAAKRALVALKAEQKVAGCRSIQSIVTPKY